MLKRTHKREIEREYMKVAEAQNEIDDLFNRLIFQTDCSYKEAMNTCNELWQKICKKINPKLKLTKANERYVFETYKPLEKEATA